MQAQTQQQTIIAFADDQSHQVPRVEKIEFNVDEPKPAGVENFNGMIPFLIRSSFIPLFKLLDSNRTHMQIDHLGNIFRGPAGAGKSFTLYSIVKFARATGWLVLYIPKTAEILENSDNEQAKLIWKQGFYGQQQLLPQRIQDLFETSPEKAVTDAVSWMKTEADHPFMIVIDQWNSILEGDNHQTLIGKLFGKKINMNRGLFFAALSSSFSSVKGKDFGIRDGEMGNYTKKVGIYTKDEAEAISNYFISNQIQLPANWNDLTGNVPRMIGYLVQRLVDSNNDQTMAILDFKRIAKEYYLSRIRIVIDRNPLTEDSIGIHELALSVALNKPLNFVHDRWEVTGMFVQAAGGVFVPSCPPVIEAFNTEFCSVALNQLCLIAEFQQIRWLALEIAVFYEWQRPNGGSVTIPNLDLKKQQRNSPASYTIKVTQTILQQSIGQQIQLLDQTLVIVAPGHPVVDAVIRQGNVLFFIQISVMAYSTHATRCDNLQTSYANLNQQSVISFFAKCAGLTNPIYQYVYITPTSGTCNFSAKHVIYVPKDSLTSFGRAWNAIAHHFQ
eukprot:c12779_g1_i1.p1 GENE.c12779_g1_i1~~c12779_g1_i1.p1  ORF type:complete len:584 (+),score=94.00 c12779_g1_i1:84-1754(+)